MSANINASTGRNRRTSAEFLVDKLLDFPEQLPPDVEQIARLHFVDALGVGLAAAEVGPVRALAAQGFKRTAETACTVLGSEQKFSPADAALINGTLIHSLEFDDTHTGSVMHGSSVLAPAVLAAAQDAGADGRTMLRAFAAGWETIIRLGLAAPGGFQNNGFQGTSVAGTIAGAAAAGLTQGLNDVQLLHSLGIAASFSAGNFTFLAEGASVKAAQAGIGAQGAISATRLAKGGVTAARGFFEGERGFFGLYAHDPSASERFRSTLTTLGSTWLIKDAAFKEFPCCHFIHPFIEAVRNTSLSFTSPYEIEEIKCRVPVGQEGIIAIPWEQKQAPAGANEGRWSLPYVLALQLVSGDVAIPDFEGEPNPDVLELAKRISWEPWEDSGYPQTFPAEIEIVLRNGAAERIFVEDVNGNRTRPWGEDQVCSKFRKNVSVAGLGPGRADRILQTFLRDRSPDLSVLD